MPCNRASKWGLLELMSWVKFNFNGKIPPDLLYYITVTTNFSQ